jgi:hypothetical protein
MEHEPDFELNDDQLDQVIGGAPPPWALLGKPDCEPADHGGCHYHGKPNVEDGYGDTPSAGF